MSSAEGYLTFLRQWLRYSHMTGAEGLKFRDAYPQIFDRTPDTGFDAHYLYQAAWASQRLAALRPRQHVDIGSDIRYVTMLSSCLPVIFVDFRPLRARLPNLNCISGDVLALPFASGSVESLSCLHVAEHIGLGRYGDALNPQGTRLACKELTRVLAPGGHLFFSVPVGRPRLCFNAHRIHHPALILEYFAGLELLDFSAVDDDGAPLMHIDPEQMVTAEYACGLFAFRQRDDHAQSR
jgi:SAM-dependent methyltransferase